MNMITDNVTIEVKTVEEAPNYKRDCPKSFKPIKIVKAIIVKEGMASGNPSVDIQCVDENGNEYLIFAKGSIVAAIGIMTNTHIRRSKTQKFLK